MKTSLSKITFLGTKLIVFVVILDNADNKDKGIKEFISLRTVGLMHDGVTIQHAVTSRRKHIRHYTRFSIV